MKTVISCFLAVAVCLVLCAQAPAKEKFTMAIVPFLEKWKTPVAVKDIPEAETLEMVKTMRAYGRFDVLSQLDFLEAMDKAAIKLDKIDAASLPAVAEKLGRRIVIFGEMTSLELVKKSDDMGLYKRNSLKCVLKADVKVYDAGSKKIEISDSFVGESVVFGTETEIAGAVPSATGKRSKLVDEAVEKLANAVRAKLVNLYKLSALVTAADGKTFTLDVGRDFGVELGDYFEIPAGKSKVVIEITDVGPDSSKASRYQGDGDVKVGAQAVQVFKK